MDQLKYISSYEKQSANVFPRASPENIAATYVNSLQHTLHRDTFLSPHLRNRLSEQIHTDFGEYIGSYQQEKSEILEHSHTQRNELHTSYLETLRLQAKDLMYQACGICENHAKNSGSINFLKGCLDTWILENIELVQQIVETQGKILISIAQMLLTPTGLWEVAKGI